jgi:hypothetical protein
MIMSAGPPARISRPARRQCRRQLINVRDRVQKCVTPQTAVSMTLAPRNQNRTQSVLYAPPSTPVRATANRNTR